MNHTSSTDIESIVQLVIDRLRSSDSANCSCRPKARSTPACSCHSTAPSNRELPPETLLQLTGKVISFRDIEGRLRGITRVRICEDAVVTPSVRDELARWKVSIERLAKHNGKNPGPIAMDHRQLPDGRLTVIVSEAKSHTLRSALPSCDFHVVGADRQCSEVVQHLLSQWESRQHWVWHTDQPYAASAAISMRANPQIQSVILVDLVELGTALEQARPNLLIIDEKRWTSHQVSRLANHWSRILRQP